ncbi:MAG: hypothetical protein B6244_08630 [Candidatus Cloacimonetes bacterium 4572_55]|nr:MAG: hypothetical protein B6244_08630 [Candidatus Cloacimonetes bacterium 4572_55]
MATLIQVLRIVVFFIVVRMIWGVLSSVLVPNSDTHINGSRQKKKNSSIWDNIDSDQVEDADYREVD